MLTVITFVTVVVVMARIVGFMVRNLIDDWNRV